MLSSLGFGAMRLTGTASGWGGPIHDSAKEIIEYAYEHGVNYFDTSYFYHGGESERFLGKTMARFPRNSWYLASKFMSGLVTVEKGKCQPTDSRFPKPIDVFNFQLDRCGVDYFDFYMLHNLSESTYGHFTDERIGIINCLAEQKAKGRIRHLGFSSHARHETIEKFLNEMKARGFNDFEYGMIQLNYFDKILQDAEKKHRVLTKHGLSVFVMEPVRGGRLTKLGAEAEALLKAKRPADSLAAWAFRYLQSLDNIPVVLSGMSNLAQVKENIKTMSAHDPLTPEETEILRRVVELSAELVPCTTCAYCVEGCPQKLDIPTLLTLYNEAEFSVGWYTEAAMKVLKEEEKPTACTFCGKCVPLCPQNIDIPHALKDFSKRFI
jgi:hypothetical protein